MEEHGPVHRVTGQHVPELVREVRAARRAEAVVEAARGLVEQATGAEFCMGCGCSLDPADKDPHDDDCWWPGLLGALDAHDTAAAPTEGETT